MRVLSTILVLSFCLALYGESVIPPYNSTGPRNVYYLTGAGNQLLTGNRTFRINQHGWTIPYIALHDAFVEKGYHFFPTLPPTLNAEFKKNVYAIYCHNFGSSHWVKMFDDLKDRMIILAIEPPHVMVTNYNPQVTSQFKKILTWDDTRVDNKTFFKYFFVQSNLEMIPDIVPFHEKKLCTLIGANKNFSHPFELYSKRREAIAFFESHAPQDFDFYGYGWDARRYKTFRGSVKSKTETFRKYKFSICYENLTNIKGWITEKIFGSFVAGCVPIYWGATNIGDFVPAKCFIDKIKLCNI